MKTLIMTSQSSISPGSNSDSEDGKSQHLEESFKSQSSISPGSNSDDFASNLRIIKSQRVAIQYLAWK